MASAGLFGSAYHALNAEVLAGVCRASVVIVDISAEGFAQSDTKGDQRPGVGVLVHRVVRRIGSRNLQRKLAHPFRSNAPERE